MYIISSNPHLTLEEGVLSLVFREENSLKEIKQVLIVTEQGFNPASNSKEHVDFCFEMCKKKKNINQISIFRRVYTFIDKG